MQLGMRSRIDPPNFPRSTLFISINTRFCSRNTLVHTLPYINDNPASPLLHQCAYSYFLMSTYCFHRAGNLFHIRWLLSEEKCQSYPQTSIFLIINIVCEKILSLHSCRFMTRLACYRETKIEQLTKKNDIERLRPIKYGHMAHNKS